MAEKIYIADSFAAVTLNELLKKQFSYFGDDYKYFSQEELASITKISLTGFSSLDILSYLPNLVELRIISGDYNMVSPDFTYDTTYFNHINSLDLNHHLNMMPNLKTLEIINDTQVKKIDLSGLVNLENLLIQNCPELEELSGMSSLRTLKSVRITGTGIKKIDNFFSYLLHTIDAEENVLDLGIFFAGISRKGDIKNLRDLNWKGLINVEFAEKNGLIGFTRLELDQVCELYERFVSLFRQRGLEHASDKEKVEYVMEYIKRNVNFANEELDERETFIRNFKDASGRTPKWADRYLGYLHSSYATFKRKKANCEGIVNLVRFMLGVLHIETENVQCNDKRSNMINTINHSIVRILIDGKYYYFDPSFDLRNRDKYYFMTFEEASTYLDLSLYEEEKMKVGRVDEQRQLHF